MSARLCALTYAVGLVEEIITVAQCILGLLIDRDSIRLDVLETMAFVCRPLAQLGERVDLPRADALRVLAGFAVARAS